MKKVVKVASMVELNELVGGKLPVYGVVDMVGFPALFVLKERYMRDYYEYSYEYDREASAVAFGEIAMNDELEAFIESEKAHWEAHWEAFEKAMKEEKEALNERKKAEAIEKAMKEEAKAKAKGFESVEAMKEEAKAKAKKSRYKRELAKAKEELEALERKIKWYEEALNKME